MTQHPRPRPATVDAVVIGAGFGGIYAVHKLHNELGLTVVGFDKADGPGGTWYWNRYPGALSDTESHLYRYSFDRDLLPTAPGRAPTSPSPRSSNTSRASSTVSTCAATSGSAPRSSPRIYSDDEGLWEVTTDDGDVYRATYVINAVGLLSAINFPNLPGLDTFEGETIHTAAWPEGKDLTGRRVGVIGTGSTGQQVITALAPKVEHLTVFVRTPQYSVPVGNRPVTPEQIDADQGRLRPDLGAGQEFRRGLRLRGEHRAGDERLRGGAQPRLRGGLAAWRRFPLHVRHLRRHRHRRGRQRGRRVLHPVQDRRDHRGPGDGPQADADRPVRQAPAVRRRLPPGLQPARTSRPSPSRRTPSARSPPTVW